MSTLTADVVIVGGGQAGPATVWALEKLEPRLKIVLVEAQRQLAAGASTASLEAFRSAWMPRAIAEQMRRSLQVFLNADEHLGEGASSALNLRRRGYLWLGLNEDDAPPLRRRVARLHEWGLKHVRSLGAADVRAEFPWLPEHVAAAQLDPLAGWLDSNALARLLARATRRTTLLLATPALAIITEKGRVTGVLTTQGAIASRAVVVAAGAGSRRLGRTAGIEIPVVVRPRQSAFTPYRHPQIPADAPLVIGRWPYPHFRPEGDGMVLAWSYAWLGRGAAGRRVAEWVEPVWPVEKLRDYRFPELTLYLLGKQFRYSAGEGFRDPAYLRRPLRHHVAYYVHREPTVAEDGERLHSERAIIDAVPEVEGLFVNVAHGGHGIMTAPAAGEIMAALVLGRQPGVPLWQDFGWKVKSLPHEESSGL